MPDENLKTYNSILENIKPLWGAVRVILAYSARKLRRYKPGISLAVSLKLMSFPMGLAVIYIAKAALDRGIFAGNLRIFLTLTLLGLAAYFINHALGYFSEKTKQRVKASFSIDVNRDFSARLFNTEYLKIKELSSTENSFILDYDYGNAENIVFGEMPSLASFLKVPVFFVLAFMLSAPLTLLVIVSLPFMAVNVIWASRGKNELYKRKMFWDQKHHACLNDTLLNIKMIKSFGREKWALERVMDFFIKKKNAFLDNQHFGGKVHFISSIFMRVNTALFWLVGGYLIIRGNLSFGSFTAVSMYTALIIAEIDNLGFVLQSLYAERSSIERCARFIKEFPRDEEEPSGEARNAFGLSGLEGDIEFKNVSFEYTSGKPVFKDLSFTVPAGKWTLIRGASGAGKTTLLCLLMRLFRPASGGIHINGRDINLIDKDKFFGWIAAVHQEPYILNDTLRNNLLLGEDAEPGEALKALSCARASELVDELALGYNTVLGESGSSISGGQRQRIAIARALARHPGILVLDEATSFVDPGMEEEIFRHIKESFPGLTVIFVTHRESGAKFADEIFFLENGRIYDKTDTRVR